MHCTWWTQNQNSCLWVIHYDTLIQASDIDFVIIQCNGPIRRVHHFCYSNVLPLKQAPSGYWSIGGSPSHLVLLSGHLGIWFHTSHLVIYLPDRLNSMLSFWMHRSVIAPISQCLDYLCTSQSCIWSFGHRVFYYYLLWFPRPPKEF